MSYFLRNGNTFRVSSEDAMDLHKALPPGNYTVQEDQFQNIFLEMVDAFTPIKRLYGKTTRHAERIINTFNDRDSSTGVMLNGEKGSGKTLLAKTISIELAKVGVPTILINQPWCGDKFNKLMQDIQQPCMVLFDEFEKVYDNDDQEAALTLLDGVFPSKKLFVFTCNNKWRVNEHMRNRPGRIYYALDFTGLDAAFIKEYCEENLNAKEHIDKICRIAALFDQFNFDMLKALVEEMNRYNESPQDALIMLNAKPEFNNSSTFDVQLFDNGEQVSFEELGDDKQWVGNPLVQEIGIEYYKKQDVQRNTDEVAEVVFKKSSLALADERGWVYCKFSPNDLNHVDAQNGVFSYTNVKGQQLKLTRVINRTYDHWAF
jgi:hypothetical protein